MTTKKKQSVEEAKELLPKELPFAPVEGVEYHDPAALQDRLKQFRQRAGLTLEALSLVTKGVDPEGKGISRVSLSRYESGAEPGLRELKILSWAFRKPIAVIVYGGQDLIEPMREPLDIMLEDLISEGVMAVLRHRKLIPEERTDRDKYKELLEAAKTIAR